MGMKNQPEPHFTFNNPNSPETMRKLLAKMCVERMIKEFREERKINT
jgi:hypothetical protein